MPFRHLDEIIKLVAPLARRFEEAGHRLYLVGGIVRDQWLDAQVGASPDLDLTTDAPPEVIKALVAWRAEALWTQGERFGTIGAQIDGRALEITTHRAEAYDPDSRKPAVTFGHDVDVDLSRRDFTVNAMAVRVPAGTLVDPWGGANDLAAGRLRTPLDPLVSFGDDPLRMLRAARFGAKYALVPTAELMRAAHALRHRLAIVAIERIGAELQRLLSLPQAGVGLSLLVEMGLAEELVAWNLDAPRDPAVTSRLARAAVTAGEIDGAWRTRLACFLLVSLDSAAAVADATRRLRLSRDDARHVNSIAARADTARRLGVGADAPSVRAWWMTGGNHDEGLVVARAIDESIAGAAVRWRQRRDDERLDELSLLTGSQIMETLDVASGPVIGDALDELRRTTIANGPFDLDAQRRHLAAWYATRQPG